MTEVFRNVLTASFHGSIVMLAVLFLRLVLKKTPKKFLCLLWLLAGIRLLMPFEIQSGLSLQPDVETIRQAPILMDLPQELPDWQQPEIQLDQAAVMTGIPQTSQMTTIIMDWEAQAETDPAEQEAQKQLVQLDTVAAYLWAAVAFGFALYTIGSYIRLKMQVREAIRIRGNVWECDKIETAFILGFIRPRIYLPMGMSQSNRRHILAHERTHLEKGDHWIKMIGFLALSIHWFNPLVWVAYILLCKDIEMACDERVVQFMELEERKSYSAALINCSTNHAHFAACPVAFGEVSVKNRVLSVLHYKKPSFWISLLGVAAIAFVAVCLVTSPKDAAVPVVTDPTDSHAPREVVNVNTVEGLLDAIAPNREIILEPGTYNLSGSVRYGVDSGSQHYTWEEASDGYTLVLTNVENLAIRGSGTHVTLVETEPRYADVIAMTDCTGVELSGFTAGHTRNRGECTGGVLRLWNCADVELNQLGLYGCGIVGLFAMDCQDISLTDSDIYECSNSAAQLHNSDGVTISGCRIYSIDRDIYASYAYFEIVDCQNVVIENSELSDSLLAHLFWSSGSQVQLRNNLFTGNRTLNGAFSIWNQDVILDGNKFQDNTIRRWYGDSDHCLVDANGKTVTEEALNEAFGTEATVPRDPQLEIHVDTVDEFLAAIGSNKEIVLDGELYDLSTATGYGTSKGDHYYWEDIHDGPGLIIHDVSNMTIRSSDGDRKGHTISALPRYADVLGFLSCSNITVSGFTAGHTKEQGSCAGGVLEFRDTDGILVENCGLFGCGILGVQTDACTGVTVRDCEIYECSQGGIRMRKTDDVTIDRTSFRDIGGNSILSFSDCKSVTVDGKELIPASGGSLSIQTEEQEQIDNLRDTVFGFLEGFAGNDAEAMSGHLASSYTGDGRTWGVTGAMANYRYFDILPEHVQAIRQQGSCSLTTEMFLWDAEAGESVVVNEVTFTVIQENGAFKIGDYVVT